jgi:spermidine synthase
VTSPEPGWFEETLHGGVCQRLEITRVLYQKKSDHQDIILFENPFFGRVLAIDGIVQTTTRDEFFYHEMLAHVPLLAHGSARDVLIIGGGDGGVLREVLRHPVARATLVELDRTVIDLCAEHMPSLSNGAFHDPRAKLVIGDGLKFVAGTGQTFDVIIVDSTDPVGPGEALFSAAFYKNCKRCLKPGGVMVAQNGVPFFQGPELTAAWKRLDPLFEDVTFYTVPVPTYVGGLMTLGWATDRLGLRETGAGVLAERYAALGLSTRYYSPQIHEAAFVLPGTITELLV